MKQIIYFSNGNIYEVLYEPAYKPPEAVPEPEFGWLVQAGDGQVPARIKHDSQLAKRNYMSRTLDPDWGFDIKITNEMVVARPGILKVDGSWKIVETSKITLWLNNWETIFRQMMGDALYDKFNTDGYGWTDGSNRPSPFNLLYCGGNLVSLTGSAEGHHFVEVYDYFEGPNYNENWYTHPHKHIKQGLVGHNSEGTYITIDKGVVGGWGDCIFPAVCDEPRAGISFEEIEIIPKLPFSTIMDGYPVTFTEYKFTGSNTFGYSEGNWYKIEEMLVTGDINNPGQGATMNDRRVYVDNWANTCPVPVIGWTRTE